MTVKIAILGLGQIGASAGLALAAHKDMLTRVGYDRDGATARRAHKLGAVDSLAGTPEAAAREAEIVLLALPVNQTQETLQWIAPQLKEDVVVLDTAPVKNAAAGWAQEILPAGRHYVGLVPAIHPEYLLNPELGLDAAHADLFQKGMLAIAPAANAPAEAVKLAADLANLLGAGVLFVDLQEVDGLMAAVHNLPQALAAALVQATMEAPGWREARKLAGPAYARAAAALVVEAKALSAAMLHNRENTLRCLDDAMDALQALRNDLEAQDAAALEARLEKAVNQREEWRSQRQSAKWAGEGAPDGMAQVSAGETFRRMFGFNRKEKR